jgi:hypothetical protein
MKNILITLFVLLILWGCNETSSTVCSLKQDDFNKIMTDSMVLYIESFGSPIEMKGNLELIEGECSVMLKVPRGDTIVVDTTYIHDTTYYIKSINRLTTIFQLDSVFKYDTIYAVDSIFISDTIFTNDTICQYKIIYDTLFQSPNTFTFDEKYDRIIGKWTFEYQMKMIDKTAPQGSFDFVLKYDD